MKYARQNYFVPVPEGKGFEELNAHLHQRCTEDLDRTLRGKGAGKKQLLEEDRAAFLPLPAASFDTRKPPPQDPAQARPITSGQRLDSHQAIR